MGLFNYHPEKLPAPLGEKRCFICNSPMRPFNRDPELDAFQYICNECNPNVIITISGSLLADNLYCRLLANQHAKQLLKRRIRTSKRDAFPITTVVASEFT